MSLRSAYNRIEALLASRGLAHYLEPYAHVKDVERLRQQYRPKNIKLLIVAESHVRRSPEAVGQRGVGFFYDRRYHTPWWPHLLTPTFGITRPDGLQWLTDHGVWLADVSVVALSGYRTVQAAWPPRALDACFADVLRISWEEHNRRNWSSELQRAESIILFDRVAAVLPAAAVLRATRLRFRVPSNARRYADEDYPYGLAAFRKAAAIVTP